MRLLFSILFSLLVLVGFSQEEQKKTKSKPATQTYQINDDLQYVYPRPKVFNFITGIPRNYANLGKESVKKNNLKWLGLTVATTGILLAGDEIFLDESHKVRDIGVTEKHEYIQLGGMVDVPTNTSATFYHFGHGNTSLIVGLGLLTVGGIKKDYRAIHTSSEILEGLFTLGFMTQGLKRVFGRESPHAATQPRGDWHGFPGWNEYMENTSHYDAMPSGHVATLTSTVTILAKNYPEIKWIRPVGYTMIGIMGVEMMNSGVHWASDYPLGFLIGYSVGSVVANSKITKVKTEKFSSRKRGFETNLTINRVGRDNLLGVRIVF
ncbi:MAG: phosphatase PAP2 family protein [Vicingaceae bacterium]